MRRWDASLPLRALQFLGPATREVVAGTGLLAGEGAADAIIVLGAAVLPGGEPSPSLRARAVGAATLWRLGVAPLIIATGAHHLRPPGEAVVIRDLLVRDGVPEDVVLLEDKSRNTLGNLLNARGILPPHLRRVYVVTEPFHMGRALHIARDVGFDPLPWPVGSPAWARPIGRVRWTLRDCLSLALHLADTSRATGE